MIYAKYTIVLKTLLDDPESKALIDKALSTYPLYDPDNKAKFSQVMTREELNKKILDHFKYREIGFETFGRWLDELEIAMNEIMPYYNQLFVSEDIINGLDDIFGNLDVTEEFEEDTNGTIISTNTNTIDKKLISNSDNNSEVNSTGTTNTTDSNSTDTTMNDNSKHVKSDTPQSQLSITADNINDVDYASEVNWNKGTSTSNVDSNGSAETTSTKKDTSSGASSTTTDEDGTITDNGSRESEGKTTHTLHRKGNQGVNTYAHDMIEFRTLFMNIAQQIINDSRIQDLFMRVY